MYVLPLHALSLHNLLPQFNSGWPISLTSDKANSILSSVGSSLSSLLGNGVASVVQNTLAKFIGATDTDTQYLQGLGSMPAPIDASGQRAYMAAVSPWFFTHFDSKNWVFICENLPTLRWEEILSLKPSLVEIVTWNGESKNIE